MRQKILPILGVILVVALIWFIYLQTPSTTGNFVKKPTYETHSWSKVANFSVKEGEVAIITLDG